MNEDGPMDPEPSSTRPERPSPVPLDQIAYFGEAGHAAALAPSVGLESALSPAELGGRQASLFSDRIVGRQDELAQIWS
jgi:hypothetical protein